MKGEAIFVKLGIHRKSRYVRHLNPSSAHIGQRVATIMYLEDICELRYLPYCQPGFFSSHSIYVRPTKYVYTFVYIKSTTVYVHSSELGLPQPLSRQRVCPSPQNQGGGGILACGSGVGGVPIPTT